MGTRPTARRICSANEHTDPTPLTRYRLNDMKTTHATLVTALLVGCNSTATLDTTVKADCDALDLGTQPTSRLPTGDVLWLPSSSGPECGSLEWTMSGDADGILLTDGSGFIGLEAGDFELRERTTGSTFSISTIDSTVPEEVPSQGISLIVSPHDVRDHRIVVGNKILG